MKGQKEQMFTDQTVRLNRKTNWCVFLLESKEPKTEGRDTRSLNLVLGLW